MKNKYVGYFVFIYIFVLLLLNIYSFSQIDLNLTLSSNQLYQSIQGFLIQLGYFNRSVSVLVFSNLVIALFICYFYILQKVKNGLFKKKQIYLLILISIIILLFSYPAFSHDIFNYMFDARIISKYHANPYFLTALDFQDDLWIRFMHWTHRTYPYGPVWLFITVPLSFLGFNKFVITLIIFKLMFCAFHLGNIFLIGKISKKVNTNKSLFSISLYSFNPLILIESILSPHNEVVMLFFLLLAFYHILINKNLLLGLFFLLFSSGIKFITILSIFPIILFRNLKTLNKPSRWIFINICILGIGLFYLIIYREPYPWYFITFIGVAVLLTEYRFLIFIMFGLSFGLLARYVPYLYTGSYSNDAKLFQTMFFIIPVILSVIVFFSSQNKRIITSK